MSVECQWTWEFGAGHAHLVGRLSGVKYVFYRMLELQAGSKPGQFILLATIDHAPDVDVDLTPQRFVGMIENGSLVLAAEHPEGDYYPDRISLQIKPDGDRMAISYDQHTSRGALTRLAELNLKAPRDAVRQGRRQRPRVRCDWRPRDNRGQLRPQEVPRLLRGLPGIFPRARRGCAGRIPKANEVS